MFQQDFKSSIKNITMKGNKTLMAFSAQTGSPFLILNEKSITEWSLTKAVRKLSEDKSKTLYFPSEVGEVSEVIFPWKRLRIKLFDPDKIVTFKW